MKTSEEKLAAQIATGIGSLAGTVVGSVEAGKDIPKPHPYEALHSDTFFEHSDVSERSILITGVSLVAGVWISIGLLYFVLTYFAHERERASPPPLPVAGTPQAVPPQPRLQQSPHRDLKAFEAGEDWELSHYHWIDKAGGSLAIPVKRAMQLVVDRGIPPTNLAPNPTLTAPEQGSRLTGFEGKVEPEPR